MNSKANEPRARAWLFTAQLDVRVHTRLANPDTDTIFPEYIREIFDRRTSYLNTRLAGLELLTCSMPTALSYHCNFGVVGMQGIYHGARMVNARTVEGIFEGVDGVYALWTALYYGQGEACPSLNEHAVFTKFLRESSLGGLEPSLMYRVDYRGVSEARQPTVRKDDERVRAWKFDAVIDVALHADILGARGEIHADYFHQRILQCIADWNQQKVAWDLISYSVQRNIFCEHARDSVVVIGYFRHGSETVRQRDVQVMLDGIPGLTVNWHAVRLGQGSRLASNKEYQDFLAASTKDEDGADSNQDKRIRVDVQGSSDAAPKKRGPMAETKQNRTALASVESIINSVGALDALPTFRLLNDSAAKPSAARAAPAPSLSAATPAGAAAASTAQAHLPPIGAPPPPPGTPRGAAPPCWPLSTPASAQMPTARRAQVRIASPP